MGELVLDDKRRLVAAAMRLENSEFATREGRGGERSGIGVYVGSVVPVSVEYLGIL